MDHKGDVVPLDENIETYLNLNLKILSYMGIHVNLSENQVVKKRTFLDKIPALIVIFLQVYCAFSQILLIVDAMKIHQYIAATEIGSDLFSNILISSKGCRLVITMAEIDSLYQELASCWRKYVPRHKIRNKILIKADNARLVCKCFIIITLCGIPIYGLTSVLNFASIIVHRNVANYTCDFSKRVFFMKYPFAINNLGTYFIVLLEEQYLLFGTGWFWICADTLFAQLTSHASLQFEMLRYDIESVINEDIADSILKRNFAILIERHKHLLRICSRIEGIYSSAILITMVLSALNICFNIFDTIEMFNVGQYKSAILHAYLVLITILEIAFYCIYAESLTQQTIAMGDAVYNSKWTDKNHKMSFYIQMLIMKSQHPFYITAYRYFPIGHIRLAKIINAAMSYFMMLRATT